MLDNTSLGSTSQRTFVIANTGSAPLSITGISASGADAAQFTASPATAAIAPGGSQTITVTFAPASPGPKSAFLVIAHNASGSPATVSLSGNGIAPPVVDTVAHLNVGNDTLTVAALTSSRREFVVPSLANPRIVPGDSQQVAIL